MKIKHAKGKECGSEAVVCAQVRLKSETTNEGNRNRVTIPSDIESNQRMGRFSCRYCPSFVGNLILFNPSFVQADAIHFLLKCEVCNSTGELGC
ncbi:hypothetical protein CEXT_281701 [Caerostris extrusa]|uniref:Uncharacterized protein n=1 Tax=Caerostris extrusa TaxID=172846 RepID=A0AAV4XNI5_CAEEX|nr:hypothetical protein CEXT_281701 [Caerostris extrusa]